VSGRIDTGGAELAYLEAGDAARPLVLCAHGFPDCARSFRHQVPALVDAGYRVVAPWMRGYAPSSLARDGRYDAAALAHDLCALGRALSPDAPVRLVGHDWGAVAAYAAAALEPERFSHLVTVAVPHLRVAAPRFFRPAQLRRSAYMAFFNVRGIAERRLAAHDFAWIDRLWSAWSPGWQPPEAELREVKRSFADASHVGAILGYYRALPGSALRRDVRRLLSARTRVPALYVHGDRDGCIGVDLVAGVERAYAAGVRVVTVENAGHFVHQEQPAAFNAELLAFLGSPPVRKK
jgi:pimeloyl-ACP methyl ester carboxylesterase